jgi:anti-sigma factor RsiW
VQRSARGSTRAAQALSQRGAVPCGAARIAVTGARDDRSDRCRDPEPGAAQPALALGSTAIAWYSSEDLAVEAVATHVRATLNDHLVQVASSDQHTVKPWLSARLDYSPPVHDLAAEGFPLVGGRLDNLDKHRVATLVYRYRLHTIDVFVRPETERSMPPLSTVRGFNVAHATGSGMDWLAVSDVSADVLSSFVQRLAASQ